MGVFIDGVYQSRPGVALGELIDIEAIEMLRGPQGTLFGRNVTAGALNIRTVAPQLDEFSGFANLTYGNFDLINLQGMINAPVSDTFGVRLTGSYRERDGFMESSIVDGAESHNRDRFIIRGQALWEPTDVTSLRLIADYQEVDENCCAAVTLTASPLLSDATRNRIFPALGFEDGLEARVFNDQEFSNSVENFNVSGELNHDFGAVSATAILAYSDFLGSSVQQEFNGGLQYSVAGETIPEANRTSFDDIQTLTAELRFQGEALDGRLDWLVGGFYADEQIVEEFTLGLGPDFAPLVGEANLPIGPAAPAYLSLFAGAGAYLQQLGAGNTGAMFMPLGGAGQFAQNRFEQDAESFSVFTHNIFALTDEVDLTVGLRYNEDTKDGLYDQVASGGNTCNAAATLLATASAAGAGDPAAQAALGALAGAVGDPATFGLITNPALLGTGAFLNCFPFSAPAIGSGFTNDGFAAFGFLPQEYSDTFEDEELIYTARLGWEPDPDFLLFAAFSHGYKAGGFNLDASAGAGGADPRFNSEEIDAYEIGFKSTVFPNRMRLNVTGFYQTMDDFQVLEFTGTRFQTFNVQDVSSKGVEAELTGRLMDDIFVNLGLTYADAAYGEDCDDNGRIVEALGLCGSSLTNAPKLSTVLGFTYDGDLLESDWGLLLNLNVATQSERRTSTRPQVVSGGVITGPTPLDIQEDSAKVNARIGFTMPNDMATLEFWGLNLTDEITRGITFNTPLQGASRSAFIDAPRQYGVTLRTRF